MVFRNTGRIRTLIHSISTALLRDEDVFAMRSSGPSSIAIGPSSDRAVFDAAIRKAAGNGLQPLGISHASMGPTDEIELRLAMTFSAASKLLDTVPASPDQRRAMLYISNGYDFERGHARASGFSRAAQRASVIVFALNAGGLPGSLAIDGRVDAAFWKQVVVTRRQSLRSIAAPTGGFALLHEMDFADAMSRIRAAVTGTPKAKPSFLGSVP
jgi:hypothetical protein